jgi:hypothetical protein
VKPGLYTVHVNDNIYQYETILVDVSKEEVRAYQYNHRVGKGLKLKYPFEINSLVRIKYEEV